MDIVWDIAMSDRFSTCRTVAGVVGTLYLLKTTLQTILVLYRFMKAYFLAPLGILRPNLKKYGEWAVVTGASEGIGKGYAMELAKRGLKVIIMSRSQTKLEKVAEEIKGKYGVEVVVVPVDFSLGQGVYSQLASILQQYQIGVLVNNVGMSYEHPEYLLDFPAEHLRNIIELNCQCMIQMTHLVLPQMVQRKKGLVINISSLMSEFPFGLVSVYSATKVFVRFFSDGLDQEYQSEGITVQCIMPGLVATAMNKLKQTTFFVMSPASFASSALNTVGHYSLTAGCVAHTIQMWLMRLWPWLSKRLSLEVMKMYREKVLKQKINDKRD